MATSSKHTGVEPGEFPYALSSGPHETRYLTWVRNHSNYMAARGLPDYARAVAVLVRGALVNALVALPALIVLGVLVALLHVLPQEPGYHITRWVMAGGAAMVLLFPFGAFLLRIRGFQRSRFRGSDSTVGERDRWERRFGLALVLIAAAALFEALPAHLADLHFWFRRNGWQAPEMAAVTGVLLALLGTSDRLLSALSGVARTLAMVVVAVLGLGLPMIVVYLVADYLVFARVGAAFTEAPPSMAAILMSPLTMFEEAKPSAYSEAGFVEALIRSITQFQLGSDLLLLGSLALALVIAFVLLMGLFSRAFDLRIFMKMLSWLLLCVVLGVSLFIVSEFFREYHLGEMQESQRNLVNAVAGDESKLIDRRQTLRLEWQKLLMDEAEPSWSRRKAELTAWWRGGWDSETVRLFTMPASNPDGEPRQELLDSATSNVDVTSAELVETDAASANPDEEAKRHAWRNQLRRMSELGLQVASPATLELAKKLEDGHSVPTQEQSDEVDQFIKLLDKFSELADSYGRADLLQRLLRPSFAEWAKERGAFYPYSLLDQLNGDLLPQLFELEDDFEERFSVLDDLHWDVFVNAMYSPDRFPTLYRELADARFHSFWVKAGPSLVLALLIWMFCWLTVDINQTSIHGLYRDRLATAFLVGADERGDVDIEQDLDLGELARHEAGSHAPYHLINVALNLQGSGDMSVRDRKSDYFIFSKLFIGGPRTGYCHSATMERVYPQTSLGAAMAISAAAASPNMGRATNPALVAFMTLLNMRLGVWIPNPGRLHQASVPKPVARDDADLGSASAIGGLDFDTVFRDELGQVQRRWQRYAGGAARRLAALDQPSTAHGLVGIGLSGGGIRSATVNLGMLQVLHQRGVFDHADYLSTVSGGGYLGASLSALMRRKTLTESPIAGRASVRRTETGELEVVISPVPRRGLAAVLDSLKRRGRQALPWRRRRAPPGPSRGTEPVSLRYAPYAQLAVADGALVEAGQRLLSTAGSEAARPASFGEQLKWRVRPAALLREMLGKLDEKYRWINVSDGGHIENLAGIELLRRRCRLILIGDGEADPMHRFGGLATLMRSARIDLGVEIDIDLEDLRRDANGLCRAHCAIGRIRYPRRDDADDAPPEEGLLLYIKSSVTGDEDEVIREYRAGSPSFPHESTADQMFSEGQFEAYRSLGQHIGEQVLAELQPRDEAGRPRPASYEDLLDWIMRRAAERAAPRSAADRPAP